MTTIQERLLQDAAKTLLDSHRVWITTHIKSDCDGIGSELALFRALSSAGKDVRIINDTHVPHSLRFLMNSEAEISVFDGTADIAFARSADTVVVLDVGLSYRLGRVQDYFLETPAKKICVDHHLECDPVFSHILSDSNATSTGEILYLLVRKMGLPLTAEVATPLFASITVDSGNFCYERCSPETFRIAADLVAAGANPYKIHLCLNWGRELEDVKLDGEVISRLEVDTSGDIAFSEVTSEMMQRLGMSPVDMPTAVNIPLSVKGVEIALLFVELEHSHIKVSARSKGRVKVSSLAKRFGGGGHPLASGFSLRVPLGKAKAEVLEAAREILSHPDVASAGEAGEEMSMGKAAN